MQIKRYEVENIQDALRQIKLELGPEAIILSTKRVRRTGGKYGILGRSVLEVVAAIDGVPPAMSAEEPLSRGVSDSRGQNLDAQIHDDLADLREAIRKAGKDGKAGDKLVGATSDGMGNFQKDLTEIKGVIYSLAAQSRINRLSTVNGALLKAYMSLKEAEVDESLALDVVERFAATGSGSSDNESVVMAEIKKLMVQDVTDCVAGLETARSHRALALIGPTGVGKTTTLAKLAARSALKDKQKVALVTLDTYRIAAVEQLKVYAKIIGVPVEVVQTPDEMSRALKKHRSVDRIYIDTIGQSQKDMEQMRELKKFFTGRDDLEVNLVLSATTKNRDLLNIIENFGQIAFDSIIFSKLDESSAFGTIYNGLLWTRRPLAYLTNGQNVPEDIEPGNYERMADLIFNGWRRNA